MFFLKNIFRVRQLLFPVETAHAEGGGVDVGGVLWLGEGVGDFVAVVFHFVVEGMSDVELEVGERGAEAIGALRLDLADQLARFAVAEHVGNGELRLLVGVQAQLAHHTDDRPVAIGPQRQMLFDFDQQTLRAHSFSPASTFGKTKHIISQSKMRPAANFFKIKGF